MEKTPKWRKHRNGENTEIIMNIKDADLIYEIRRLMLLQI